MQKTLYFFLLFLFFLSAFCFSQHQRRQQRTNSESELSERGELLLYVTSAPYNADSTGKVDCTKAIQQAIIDARDSRKVCYFPSGTYLVSESLSCEQVVIEQDIPKYTDEMRQSWWENANRIYLLGATKGGRPVIKLSSKAIGFDDPENPKIVMKIWAQTRNDYFGIHEPLFGQEQPNISFNNILRGIDFDISGHAGAVGLRHAGSQGCLLMDCKINAAGAFAGFNNCPGQGGGTYNIEAYGGQYGLLADNNFRFPMLAGCTFKGQTKACIGYVNSNLPMMLVGCYLESEGKSIIDVTKMNEFAGISMVDCVVSMKNEGVVINQQNVSNLFMENVLVKGINNLQSNGQKINQANSWTVIKRFSNCNQNSEMIVNGEKLNKIFFEAVLSEKDPDFSEFKVKHWTNLPASDNVDVVNIKDFGAKGNATTDDTQALKNALAKSKKIYFPKGNYKISEAITLPANTQLFGISGSTIIVPTIITADNINDATLFSFISIRGNIQWGSGKGVMAFASGTIDFTKNGGGRFYAIRRIGSGEPGKLLENTIQPISLYTLNVERQRTNPQVFVRNVKGLRIYFLKSEASPSGYSVDGGANSGNTPLAIINSEDVKLYCASGNVQTTDNRPFIDVKDSRKVVISQVKSFNSGDFPQIRETTENKVVEISSKKTMALFIRD